MSDQPETALTTESDNSNGYSSVTHQKALEILQLRKAKPDIQGNEIARIVGVAPSTVSRWLKLLETDTVPVARQLAKSQSLRATMKLSDQIDSNDPRVSQGAAKAITALAGVQEGSSQVSVGVQVIVGNQAQPAGPDPFESIDATIVESKD